MERTTNMDTNESVNHLPSRRRTGSKEDYRALLDSTEQKQTHEFVIRTPFGVIRDVRRLTYLELFFLALATLTILGLLAMAMERFVNLHRQFGQFMPKINNCTNSSNDISNSQEVAELIAERMQLYELQYDRGYNMEKNSDDELFDFGDLYDSDDGNNSCKNCDSWTCTNDFIFAVALVVNLFFCSFYCYNGLLRERQFELLGYAVGMTIILLSVIINYCMVGREDDYTKLVRLVLMSVFGPQNIVVAVIVSARMGYFALNTVGSSQNLIRAYRTRSLFLTLQIFNLQLLANITVLAWAKGGLFIIVGEKVILFILLAYLVAVAYIGWASLTWELGSLAILWHILIMPVPGFYIYKIANVAHHWSEYKEVYAEYSFQGHPGSPTHFIYIAASIITACCAGMLCCIVLSILMMITHSNFGRGLKEKLPPPCCSEGEQLS